MKKFGIISFVILLLGVSGYFLYPHLFPKETAPVLAEEAAANIQEVEISEEDNFPINYNVPADHRWEISFDEELSQDTITAETVFVLDDEGTPIDSTFSLEDNGHTVVIMPPANGYNKGEYYELHMADSIAYVDGEKVSKAYKMGFFVARDEVENVTYNEAIIPIDEEAVVSDKENTLVVLESALTTELAEGDILKIPSTHEVFEEKAIKIDTFQKENGQVTITYSQPKFQELFEEIDIYKAYDLAGEDVIFIPEDNIQAQQITSIETDSMLASSSKAEKQKEFKVKPISKKDISFGYNNGYEFTFKNLEIDIKDYTTVLNGKINIKNPEAVWDIDMGLFEFNKLHAQVAFSRKINIEETLKIKTVEKEKKKKSKNKKSKNKNSKNNGWLLEKEIPLAKVYVPVVPGLFVKGEISGVIGLNPVTGKAELELKNTLNSEEKMVVGLKQKKDEFDLIFDYDPEISNALYVKGSAEAKVTGEFEAGITALEVIGVEIGTEGGGYATGEGLAGASSESPMWCYKYEAGLIFGGGVSLDSLLKDNLPNYKIDELKYMLNDQNTCEELRDITVYPEKITAKPGETVELKIAGNYLDTSTGLDTEKSLLIGEKSIDKLAIMTGDPAVSNIKIRETKSKLSTSGNIKGNKEVNVKIKSDKHYKVLLKVPEDPANDQTTITITYDGEFKKEIPVTLTGVQKELPPAEAKQVIENLYGGVLNTYFDLGEKHNWTKMDNPPDFDVLRPALLKYATSKFTDDTLKIIADDMYCQCDFIVTPVVNFDIRFNIHENTANKLVISTIQFEDMHSSVGQTVYFTAVKKNGEWFLDSWEYVSPAKENMNVTWEEYAAYSHNSAELINEVQDGNRKVYIIDYPNVTFIQGVYADSTEIVLDVPKEWLPAEYQQQTASGLNGYWTIQEGKVGTMLISNETEETFDFSIHVNSIANSPHVGEIEGTSTIDGNTALFSDENGCTLDFSMNGDEINVIESYECMHWHGMNVNFDGTYRRE